jgi:hypothetical protein
MKKKNFDPFRDRRARDIRNTLSAAFIQSVKNLTPSAFEAEGKSLLGLETSEDKKEYILDRLSRYRKCFNTFELQPDLSPLQQSLILWDAELFFEVHEILEGLWTKAEGREKLALQGLIRAAGVYILMDGGSRQGIEKMAAKAIRALEENLSVLTDFPSPQRLLSKLENIDPVPPKLLE